MLIKNVRALLPEGTLRETALVLSEGRIAETAPSADTDVLDGHGLIALPGLVDLHFHGALGHDLCDADAEGLQSICDFEARHGVLAVCPATMTYPESRLDQVMRCAAGHVNGRGADLIGINMEGPFINPDRVGAQNPKYVMPADAGMFRRLQEAARGLIRLVDVAPEIPGNIGFIREVSGEVRVSLAHMKADYDTACAAFEAGAKQLTHTYNAMPLPMHRAPGPIPAGAEHGADAELIADGVHVHPAMVRLLFRLFGPEHVILISDSMRACGLPDGEYDLGGQQVTVRGSRAVLTDQPDVIAGSVTCLYDCFRTAVMEMRVPLADAARAAGTNPARALGVDRDYGSLRPGAYANVILADDQLNIRAIIQKGRQIA